MMLLAAAALSWFGPATPALRHRTVHAAMTRSAQPGFSMSASSENVVPMESTSPSPNLEVREVISSMMAALHPSNHDKPKELYGFEVALRFLAPTHSAKIRGAKPGGFARYLRQPHKASQISWSDYRYEGEVVYLKSDEGVEEAYQMTSMRSSPTADWTPARWKLVKVAGDFGESVMPSQWMVEAVYSGEPDTPEDIEFLRQHQALPAGEASIESPRAVVEMVMKALRDMDEPYELHGAVVATRYCSPRNRASELSPQVFARYLEDPWYSILTEWDEMQEEETDDFLLDDYLAGQASTDVLVRREDEEDFTMVSWDLSLYDGQWVCAPCRPSLLRMPRERPCLHSLQPLTSEPLSLRAPLCLCTLSLLISSSRQLINSLNIIS